MGIIAFCMFLFGSCGVAPIEAARTGTPDIHPTNNTNVPTQFQATFLPIVKTASCTTGKFGTMLINGQPGDRIDPADVMLFANDQMRVNGLVAAGAPSDTVRDEWFSRLSGWTRTFIRGTYDQLEPIHESAMVFDMENMYECIGYGPESTHQAGPEALEPLKWVPMAKGIASSSGKCLIYGPAVRDYELMSTPEGELQPDPALLGQLITNVAPSVDIWMIQLAKYQVWADGGHDDDGNPYTMQDFSNWVSFWVTHIKNGNPNAKVWVQLGIGVFDPVTQVCLLPQPPDYILDYRNLLIKAGVDGLFVAPSQPCLESSDPQDRENYMKSLEVFQQAIDLACRN